MKKVLFVLGLLASGLGFAQDSTEQDTVQDTQPVHVPQIVVKVPYGELTSFGDMGIKIVKVTDSRCPSNVTCIWAGNVVLDYELYEKGKFVETRKLTVGGSAAESSNLFFKNVAQELLAYSVAPYPKTSLSKIPQEEYVINVRWNQLQEN